MMKSSSTPNHILPLIVFAQFAGTSLWFATNAVIADIQEAFSLPSEVVGDITSAVQFGFIVGTLLFAILSIADRFSPVLVFLYSAILGAIFNLSIIYWAQGLTFIIIARFAVGVCLAGIYPVGMKIASDWYAAGLGKALGYLVGALVLGTAFPHLLNILGHTFSWTMVLWSTSILAIAGAVLLYLFLSDGPHRKSGSTFKWNVIPHIFKVKAFRSAAFGYFGHMWELYAFWSFVPLILITYNDSHQSALPVSLWSFVIIGVGSLGCIIGGYISLKRGSAQVAFGMLLISGIGCLLSPLFFHFAPIVFLGALMIWGFTVVGDSPQFSTIVVQTAPKEYIGTALTIVNCIGFSLTIVSIQLIQYLQHMLPTTMLFLVLVIGPVLGLWVLGRGSLFTFS